MNSIFSKTNSGTFSSWSDRDRTQGFRTEIPGSRAGTQGSRAGTQGSRDICELTSGPKKINPIDSLSDPENQDTNEQESGQMILALNDILATIPGEAESHPDPKLQKTHTEWRWRFFDLKGRKLIEISQKKPNSNRLYVDNTGKWINFELRGNWDQFLVDTKYCYIE
jgi:hypothetical protein